MVVWTRLADARLMFATRDPLWRNLHVWWPGTNADTSSSAPRTSNLTRREHGTCNSAYAHVSSAGTLFSAKSPMSNKVKGNLEATASFAPPPAYLPKVP